MAIKNFNFPGVTLTQEFVASNVGNQTVLSVACIGRPYYLHRADVASEAAVTSVTISTAGSASTNYALPGVVTEVPVDGGTPFVPAIDTEYRKIFVQDGLFAHAAISSLSQAVAASASTATVDCKKNVKSGLGQTADTVFGSREAQLGDSVTITGTSISGIAKVRSISKSATTGGYGTVELDLTGATIGASGGTITALNFLVEADTYLVDSSGDTSVNISGTTTFNVKAGAGARVVDNQFGLLQAGTYTMAVEYRQPNGLFKGKLGQVYNADAVDEILGGACLANPLALAVKLACLAAPDTLVYFTTPTTTKDTVDGFREALDFLSKYEEIYSIVPIITDLDAGVTYNAIIAALLNDVITVSEDEESKIRRALWYGIGNVWDNTMDTNQKKINAVIASRQEIPNSYKAQAVWADSAAYNGETIPNSILAAAPAGMRSYQPCHRPLSNMPYSFLTAKEPNGFTKSQLKQLGSEGIWIIANNSDEIPINMKQVTTAVANDLNQDEESIVANVDEICLSLCHIGEDSVGCSNINDTMILALSDDISILMDSKTINQTGSAYIGAQLLSWSLDNIYQDPIHKDRIYAVISCEPPKPFNEFKITLRVI